MFKVEVKKLEKLDNNQYSLTTTKVNNWIIRLDNTDPNLYYCFNGKDSGYNDLYYFYVLKNNTNNKSIMLCENIRSHSKSDRLSKLEEFKKRAVNYFNKIIGDSQ